MLIIELRSAHGSVSPQGSGTTAEITEERLRKTSRMTGWAACADCAVWQEERKSASSWLSSPGKERIPNEQFFATVRESCFCTLGKGEGVMGFLGAAPQLWYRVG